MLHTVQTEAYLHLCVGESVLHVHLASCVLSYSSQAPGILTGQLSQLIIAHPDLGVPLRQLPTVRSLLKSTNTHTSWHTLMKCQIGDRCTHFLIYKDFVCRSTDPPEMQSCCKSQNKTEIRFLVQGTQVMVVSHCP